MRSDKQGPIDAIGAVNDDDLKKLYRDGDANSEGVRKVTNAKPGDRRDAMIDAVAGDYLSGDSNELPVDDWLDMNRPTMTP